MTNHTSHVVGNCANISCEGGQHCNATKDGPKSGNSSIDSNGKGNAFSSLTGHLSRPALIW